MEMNTGYRKGEHNKIKFTRQEFQPNPHMFKKDLSV